MGVVAAAMALVRLPRGQAATVADVRCADGSDGGLPARLRELGFVDGEEVRVLAAGPVGGPLAVRVGASTFALRAREAACVFVHRAPA